MLAPTLALVEGERCRLSSLLDERRASERRRYRVERTEWCRFSPEALRKANPSLVLADLTAPSTDALECFARWLASEGCLSPLLVLVSAGKSDERCRAVCSRADDVMWDPVSQDELHHRVGRVLGTSEQRGDETSGRARLRQRTMLGKAEVFEQVLDKVELFARADCPVLIEGETGTGKEVCARTIHDSGPRSGRAFVPVDCAAIPDHLFENELFGHARGAFTDARSDQRGLVALADGGTLFLDEIDALPLGVQPKLLRFLQERTYRPLGGEKFLRADVNVIAATNQDIERLLRERKFRSDLFFRLNVFSVNLPPLRARGGDVELLAEHFLAASNCRGTPCRKTFSPAAMRKLSEYGWPGNIRELLNVVQRAIALAEGHFILPSHIVLANERCSTTPPPEGFRDARAQAIAAFERAYVADLFFRHGGNVTQAARAAQKDRRAFGRLVKKYGLSNQRD